MNTQEQKQLNQFLQQLVEVKLPEKDKEAQELITQAIAHQPDATYLLVQRCLIQDQALQAAQSQIADLQAQLQQQDTSSRKNFLDNNPWAATAHSNDGVPGASNYQMPPNAAAANQSYARPAQGSANGIGSGFLGNVASTAAGVVAGSFLFQGIGNLLGHHASAPTGAQPAADEHLTEQTIINNYYGDDNQLAEHGEGNAQLASYDDDLLDESDFDSDWV